MPPPPIESSRRSDGTEPIPEDVVRANRRFHESERRISLLLYHREGAEVTLLLPGVSIVVGRASPSDVCIPDTTLSREHTRFTLSGGRVLVEDLNSTNGTWMAGERIQRAELKVGDEVMLSNVLACVHALGSAEENLEVESEERFRLRLEEEVVRARHLRSHFALLMVRAERTPSAHVGRWSRKVRSALRPIDRMGLYSPDAVQILLPAAGEATALELAAKIIAQRREQDPLLFIGLALFPDSASTAEKLVELSCHAANSATAAHPVYAAPAAPWRAQEAIDSEESIVAGPVLRETLAMVERLATSRIPVILQGETGTGKEVLARLIHESGPRRDRPMVCVNCGALPRELVESTLFGHERGAFTGALERRRGLFEEADGGTVFLDEIGELPSAAQTALLRVLETHRFTRVGGMGREISVDVRIIAATHRDLEKMRLEGQFRDDLYYRLSTITLQIPPLRERPEDIEPLAFRFLRQANKMNNCDVQGIDKEALARLLSYSWPGNVRELKNAIDRAVVIARGNTLREQDLPARLRAAASAVATVKPDSTSDPPLPTSDAEVKSGSRSTEPASHPAYEFDSDVPPSAGGAGDYRTRMQQYETQLILDALEHSLWNQTEAARRLKMPLRTLVHKLKALGINRKRNR